MAVTGEAETNDSPSKKPVDPPAVADGRVEKPTAPDMASETNASEDSEPAVKLEGEELMKAIKVQVEYYFSQQNLAADSYLVSQMNADLFVPLSLVANFKQMKALTTDVPIIFEAIKDSDKVIVDETQQMVKPNIKASRNTLILRDLSSDTKPEEVKGIFECKEDCPVPTQVRGDINDTWFVTFDSEQDCLNAHMKLIGTTFNDKPIKARVKSENLLRTFYTPGQESGPSNGAAMYPGQGSPTYYGNPPFGFIPGGRGGYTHPGQFPPVGYGYPGGFEPPFNHGYDTRNIVPFSDRRYGNNWKGNNQRGGRGGGMLNNRDGKKIGYPAGAGAQTPGVQNPMNAPRPNAENRGATAQKQSRKTKNGNNNQRGNNEARPGTAGKPNAPGKPEEPNKPLPLNNLQMFPELPSAGGGGGKKGKDAESSNHIEEASADGDAVPHNDAPALDVAGTQTPTRDDDLVTNDSKQDVNSKGKAKKAADKRATSLAKEKKVAWGNADGVVAKEIPAPKEKPPVAMEAPATTPAIEELPSEESKPFSYAAAAKAAAAKKEIA